MNNSQTKSLQYLEKSGEALQIAEQIVNDLEAEKQAAAKLVPGITDRLVESKLIESHEKEAALNQLGDHAGALKVVNNLLTAMSQQKTAYEQKLAVNPGLPVGDHSGQSKQASESKSRGNSNYVGRRLGAGEKSAADKVFMERLGLS